MQIGPTLCFSGNNDPRCPRVFSTDTTFFQIFPTCSCLSLRVQNLYIWTVGRVYTELAPTHLEEKTLVEDSVFYVSYIYLEGKLCKSLRKCVCVLCACTRVCVRKYAHAREVRSFLQLYGVWGSNSGGQAQWQAPLPAEPSRSPLGKDFKSEDEMSY